MINFILFLIAFAFGSLENESVNNFVKNYLLFVIIAIIVLAQFIASVLKIPPVVFILVVGALIGPNGIKLVEDTEFTKQLQEIGLVLLLYIIGLNIEFLYLIKNFIKSIGFFVFYNGILFLFIYLIFKYLFSYIDEYIIYIIALAFSFTSTAISYGLAKDIGYNDKRVFKLSVTRSLIEDMISVLIIVLAIDIKDGINVNQITDFIISNFTNLFLFILILFLSRFLLNLVVNNLEDTQTIFNFFLAIIGIFLFIGYLLNLPVSIVAFLVGVYSNTFINKINVVKENLLIFSDLFVSIFFINLGATLDLKILLDIDFLLTISLPIVFILLIKLVLAFLYLVMVKEDPIESLYAATLNIPIGEFTVLIISLFASLIPNYNYISALIFVSILLSSILSFILISLINFLLKKYDYSRN
jgi:Kef-type K+ transport system membrane component KefB